MNTQPHTPTTTLSTDTTAPSSTAPGDGPADTTDPTQVAVSVRPQPGSTALAAGTVNTVTLSPRRPQPAATDTERRTEQYTTTAPNGQPVTVRRDLETGVTEVIA